MPNAQQILANPKFHSLSTKAQLYVLRRADSEFASLPVTKQLRTITEYKSPQQTVNEQLAAAPGGQVTARPQPSGWRDAVKRLVAEPLTGLEETIEGGPAKAATAYRRLRGKEPVTMIDPETGQRAKPIDTPGEIANLAEGVFAASAPVTAPMASVAAAAAPLPFLAEMAGGYLLGQGARKGVEAAGGGEGAQRLAEISGGIVPVVGTASRVARLAHNPFAAAKGPIPTPAPASPTSTVPSGLAESSRGLPTKSQKIVGQPSPSTTRSAQRMEPGVGGLEQSSRGLFDPSRGPQEAAAPMATVVEQPATIKPTVARKAAQAAPEPKQTAGRKVALGDKQSGHIRWAKARVQRELGITADEVKTLDPQDQRAYYDLVYQFARETKGSLDIDALRARLNPESKQRVDTLLGRAAAKQQKPLERFHEKMAAYQAELPDKMVEFEANWIDRYAPSKRMIEKAGSDLPPEIDPYVAQRLFSGHQGKAEAKLAELNDILSPMGSQRDNITADLLFNRYGELYKNGITKFPKGQTIEDIRAAKADFIKKTPPETLKAIRDTEFAYHRWQDKTLDEAVAAGVISKEQAAGTRARNEQYIPLDRLDYVAENLDRVPYGTKAFNVSKQDLLKKIEGSEREVRNPWQSIIDKTYRATNLIERNKAVRKMYDLAERPEFSGIVVKLGPNSTVPQGMEAVNVLVDGVKRQFAVPQVVADSVKGMTPKQVDFVTRIAQLSTRSARAGQTVLNYAFFPFNAWRDFNNTLVNTKAGVNPLDIVKGYGISIAGPSSPVFREYLASGAAFSGYMESRKLPMAARALFRTHAQQRIWSKLESPLELIRSPGEVLEQGPRIAEFVKSKKRGMSTEEAALGSRDVTVDFNKVGQKMLGYSQWVPYINARGHGNLNVAKALSRSPKRSAAIISSMVAAPVVATYAWNVTNYPEIWEDIQPWQKQENFLWIYGDGRDEEGNPVDVLPIPKVEFVKFFAQPLENFLEYMHGYDPQSIGRMATEMVNDISPITFAQEGEVSLGRIAGSAMPVAARSVGELAGNANWWTGRPLETQQDLAVDPEERFNERTPESLVAFGQLMGWSPKKLHHFVRSQFGGLGEQAAYAVGGQPASAVGTVTRRFKVYGRAKESEQYEAIRSANRKVATEQRRIERQAVRLRDELTIAPNEAARDLLLREGLRSGQITPEVLKEVNELQAAKTENLSGPERSMRSQPVGARAQVIWDQLQGLEPRQRGTLMADYTRKRIITKAVREELLRIAKRQNRKPQE